MYDTVCEVLNDAVITIQSLHFFEILGKYQKYLKTETRERGNEEENVLSDSNGQGPTTNPDRFCFIQGMVHG